MRREWIEPDGTFVLMDSADLWSKVFLLLDEWIGGDAAGRCATRAEKAFVEHGPGWPA